MKRRAGPPPDPRYTAPVTSTPCGCALLLAALLAAAPASPTPAVPPPTPPSPAHQPADASSTPAAVQRGPDADPWAGLPHQVRVGARVALIRRNLPVVPTVVIVPDGASYVAAISRWSMSARYPVLIDDGSWAAQRDIARFVRAFAPASVVRWSDPGASLPADPHGRRHLIEAAVASAWEAQDAASLPDKWESVSLRPPGVVAMNESDPAWTAGLALAAGRGQIIAWVPGSRDQVGGAAPMLEVDERSALIEQACESSGYSWEALGDDIDAVTLCLNHPVKIALGENDKRGMLATSDVIGRHREGERTRRWAWGGQVFGNEAAAAYRAMCGLFLQPRNAWLFDGYDATQPWVQWDATAAATELEKAGIATVVNDTDAQGVEDFRLRASGRNRGAAPAGGEGAFLGGVRFGMILVNSSGNAEFFDLRPGQALAGDVPVLAHPALVHFVHSWSATRPDDRGTIGGRFLEHGAYAYVGAVHEPYLQAFVPTPLFARRMLARAPLGIAARLDTGPAWKVAILGDPLIVVGPDPVRLDPSKLPLGPADGSEGRPGPVSLQTSLAAALKERRFADAVRDLAMMGRDADAVRLVRALIAENEDLVTPDTARAAIESAYLAGAFDLVPRLFPLAISGTAGEGQVAGGLRDILWHTLWPTLSTLRSEEVDALRLALRPDQIARDAAEVYHAIRRSGEGDEAAKRFADQARARMSDEERRRFNELLAR